MTGPARRHDVLVSGVGVHTAHGDGPATLEAVRGGRSGVVAFRTPEADGFPEVAGAPAASYALADLVPDRKLHKYMSRAASLAVLAAGRALRDAGLLDDPRREGLALYAATGLIGFELDQVANAMSVSGEGLDGERMARGLALLHPLTPFRMLLNMPLGLVSIAYGLRGENAILYPGPLQGGAALAMAHQAVASGRCPRALAGGSVHGLALLPLASALRSGRLARSPEETAHRGGARGVAATDAAAFVLLESAEAARERGARPRAALVEVEVDPADDADFPVAGKPLAQPPVAVATGSVDSEQDAADLRWAEAEGAAPGTLLRVDPLAGHAGPAAPALAAALAALAVADARGPSAAVALARDPDGGAVLARLARAPEARA